MFASTSLGFGLLALPFLLLAAPALRLLAAAAAARLRHRRMSGTAPVAHRTPDGSAGATLLACLTGHAALLGPAIAALVIAGALPPSGAASWLAWHFAGALSGLSLLALLPLWPLDGGRCLTLVLDACTPVQAALVTATAPLVFMALALQLQSTAGVALAIVGALLALSMRCPDRSALGHGAAALALAAWLTTAAAHGSVVLVVLSRL